MIEYQPMLFDTFATDLLRRQLEKQRRSFFVRYNALEHKYKELEQRFHILEKGVCAISQPCTITQQSGPAAQQDSTNLESNLC